MYLGKIEGLGRRIRNTNDVNLLIPFLLVLFFIILSVLPGSYLSKGLFSTVEDTKAQQVITIAVIIAPLFAGIIGFISWIIISSIYYQICKIFMSFDESKVNFRKFLWVAGFMYPIKVTVFLLLFFVYFKIGGFGLEMDFESYTKYMESWGTASDRINVLSTYMYVSFLALASSSLFKETVMKTSLVLVGTYTTWIIAIAIIKMII